MTIDELGEFGLIRHFRQISDKDLKGETVGIGDDCAVLPFSETEDILVTTDMLLEDTHFLKKDISPEDLGWKSLAVNLSDIAAMGGIPIASFLSIGIPSGTDIEYLDKFMEGYRSAGKMYDVPLLGGDTTKSPSMLAINVGVVGRCKKGEAILRSGAKVGDAVCVTGFLGDSAAGLDIVIGRESAAPIGEDERYLVSKHYRPSPRILEGRFLNGYGIHSMMDISDGLASDLTHILEASGVSAVIDLDKIPLSGQIQRVSKSKGYDAPVLAVTGGEDYELLFTVSTDMLDKLKCDFENKFRCPVYQIGHIEKGTPEIHWLRDGREINVNRKGYDHFGG